MAEKQGTRQTEEVVLGKKFRGETFVTVKSAAQVEDEAKLHEQHADELAVPIAVYFSLRGHFDHTLQTMMLAHTKVRKATPEAFDDLFHTFFHTTPKPTPKAKVAPKAEPDKEV